MNIYRENTLLLWQAGSRLWGTDTPESDQDFIGVFVEPSRFLVGTEERIPAVFTETNAKVGEDGNRLKSTHDTIETKWYSAREFLVRCLKGDPNLVPLLWAYSQSSTFPAETYLEAIRQLLSQQVIAHHVMQVVERQKSIEKRMRQKEEEQPVWKDAMHMYRVAVQAFILADKGRVRYPLYDFMQSTMQNIRAGKVSWQTVVEVTKDVMSQTALANPALPKDEEIAPLLANNTLEFVYTTWWKFPQTWGMKP